MNKPNPNLGICLGRILFSFLVVCCHFFSSGLGEAVIKPVRGMAVPFFFVVSFYFATRSISHKSGSTMRMRDRLLRIYRPFWFWGIVLAPFFAATILLPRPTPDRLTTAVAGIVQQLLFGHVYDHPLWFLFLLGLFQFAYLRIAAAGLSRKTTCWGVIALLTLSYCLQYSGANSWFWGRFPFAIKYPFGRIAECIPFAIAGVLLCRSDIAGKISSKRIVWPSLLVLAVLSWPRPFFPIPASHSFEYAGLHMVRCGVALSLFFFVMPISRVPSFVSSTIRFVSDVSLGVFCIHVPVGFVVKRLFQAAEFRIPDLALCLLIYVVSVSLCKMLLRLSNNRLKPFIE